MACHAVLDGILTRDPRITPFTSGDDRCIDFAVASDRFAVNPDSGETERVTDVYNVRSFSESLVKAVENGSLAKGTSVTVYGMGELGEYTPDGGGHPEDIVTINADRVAIHDYSYDLQNDADAMPVITEAPEDDFDPFADLA